MSQYNTDLESIRSICLQNLPGKYPGDFQEEAKKRLEAELDILDRLGLVDIISIAKDISQFARSKNIFCRLVDAACGSLVNYLLEISDVDPFRYQLMFEQFCDEKSGWLHEFVFIVDPSYLESVKAFARSKCGARLLGEETSFFRELFENVVPHFIFKVGLEQSENNTKKAEFHFRFATPRNLLPQLIARQIQQEDPSFRLEQILLDDLESWNLIREGSIFHPFPFDQELGGCPTLGSDGEYFSVWWPILWWPSAYWDWEVNSIQDMARAYAWATSDDKWENQNGNSFVFQEDIMDTLNREGGFSFSDAYYFIQAVKSGNWKECDNLRNQFLKHAPMKIGSDVALTLINRMEDDARFVACKCRIIPEAITNYQVIYLKNYYPEQFLATCRQRWPRLKITLHTDVKYDLFVEDEDPKFPVDGSF